MNGVPTPANSGGDIIDPAAVLFTDRLCAAIEHYTASQIAIDSSSFQCRGVTLRYVVERHLYFSLINDGDLYAAFKAKEDRHAIKDLRLSPLAHLVSPYLLDDTRTAPVARSPGFVTRFIRNRLRLRGRAAFRSDGVDASRVEVFFLISHPKFVDYLKPIADSIQRPYAFLVYGDLKLHEEIARRGLPVFCVEVEPLKATSRKFGPFEIFFQQFNALRHSLAQLKPSCIVIPEGNAPVFELVNRAAQSLSIKTLCVQQGWSPIVHSGFRNMNYTLMCVWGAGFSDLLKPYNPLQRFRASGNHVLTLHKREAGTKRHAIGFFLQKDSRLITDTAWQEMLEFVRWNARHFPQSEIRVREHPGNPLSANEIDSLAPLPNLKIMNAGSWTLDQVLNDCRVAVAIFSTTILEAAAAGIVPLIVNVTGMPRYNPDIAALGAAVEVHDFDDARQAMERLITDDERMEQFRDGLREVRERFFAQDRGQAISSIAAEISILCSP